MNNQNQVNILHQFYIFLHNYHHLHMRIIFHEDNLYYSSMILSNLGSIKCGAIHHNLTNFGTCSSLATIGEIKEETRIELPKPEYGSGLPFMETLKRLLLHS